MAYYKLIGKKPVACKNSEEFYAWYYKDPNRTLLAQTLVWGTCVRTVFDGNCGEDGALNPFLFYTGVTGNGNIHTIRYRSWQEAELTHDALVGHVFVSLAKNSFNNWDKS